MRDGTYAIAESTTVEALANCVEDARATGFTPQAQPFVFKGMICQVMTKVEPKDMSDSVFERECVRRGVRTISLIPS